MQTPKPVNRIASVPSTQSLAPTPPVTPKPQLFKARSSSEMVDEIKRKYWRFLEGIHKPPAWEALDSGYGGPCRAYHAWGHIFELLHNLDEFSSLSTKPQLVATAIFWHDAFYVTQNPDGSRRLDYDNVRDSAELFRRYTLLNPTDAGAVHELIMATADHINAEAKQLHYPGFVGDLELFLDLDLSPLAVPWENFAANLEKIRFEYSWASEAVFYSGQLRMLEGFIKADARLFRRDETRRKWLKAATANLKLCITDLRVRLA
jgi:predicted metal-dependent HD superfamily phosphohydrolase